MQSPYHHDRFRHVALALLLAGLLLAAQWIGTMHRVVHSGLFQKAHVSAEATVDVLSVISDWSAALTHSCAAFDAATLADAAPTSVIAFATVANLYEITQQAAFTSWTAPVVPCFSSRGPPLA